MDWLTFVSNIGVALIAFLGVYISNRKSASLMEYRINQLEIKMDKHNQLQDRVHTLEEKEVLHTEQIKVANHRIEDLEKRGWPA